MQGILKILTFFSLIFLIVPKTKSQNHDLDSKIGYEYSFKIEQSIGVYDDSAKSDYVKLIGQRLIKHLEQKLFDYHFRILDSSEPNAFALPGGYVYITRGLLLLLNSEDELACVMAHEIIHSQERHTIKQMRKSILPGILQIPGSIIGGIAGQDVGILINSPILYGSKIYLSGYSRKNERKADQLGMSLAAKAGYDPGKLGVILASISKELELRTGEKEKKNYLTDHPYTPDRVEYIQKTKENLDISPINKELEDNLFVTILNDLVVDQNPEQGLVIENAFIHPKLKIKMEFPENWTIRNSPLMVAAIDPDHSAAIVLRINEEESDPDSAALKFHRAIRNENIETLTNESIHINNLQAHLLTLRSFQDERYSYFQSAWIKKDSLLYNLIGVAPENLKEDLKSTTLSFQPVLNDDWDNIQYKKVKVVTSHEGESLTEIISRNQSVEDKELTGIINNLESDYIFDNNRLVKVIISKKYVD